MFLDKLNILEGFLGDCQRSGTEYLFYCPAHEHHKPKLSVNLEKNVTKCWVCGETFRSIRFFVRKYGKREHKDAWQKVSEQTDLSELLELDSKTDVVELPKEFEPITNFQSSEIFRARRLLENKKVWDRRILYKIGICKTGQYRERVIIPSFDSRGNINYFVGRTYSSTTTRKYVQPPAPNQIIFNDYMIDWRKPVILVENPFDSMVVPNSIPLLGSTLSDGTFLFTKICELSEEVIVSLDLDAEKKEDRVVKTLQEYGLTVTFLEKKKDFSEMTEKEIENMIINRKEHTFEEDFMRKLRNI
jgi:hypothetical protein